MDLLNAENGISSTVKRIFKSKKVKGYDIEVEFDRVIASYIVTVSSADTQFAIRRFISLQELMRFRGSEMKIVAAYAEEMADKILKGGR